MGAVFSSKVEEVMVAEGFVGCSLLAFSHFLFHLLYLSLSFVLPCHKEILLHYKASFDIVEFGKVTSL